MPYADPEDRRANNRKLYLASRSAVMKRTMNHRRENPKLHAYWGQRHTCKQRGIEFNMTFDEWAGWWGDDFALRGRKENDLCMCRYSDEGPYEIGNIYKDTNLNNKLGPREKDEGLHEDIPF